MFPSQASYTFNPLLPFTPYVSTQPFPLDAIPPFAGHKILQSVADFIFPSHSSSPIFKLTPTTPHSVSTPCSQEASRVQAPFAYDSLEDAVSRLLGHYQRLYIAMKTTQPRYSELHTKSLDFSTKAYLLSEINQFKWCVINLLCRLAALALECPRAPLLNHFVMIHTALSCSNSFKAVLQGYRSYNIRELTTTLFNVPMGMENSLYTTYIISYESKPRAKTEEQVRDPKLSSIKCSGPKNLGYETSVDMMDILRSKKTTSCSEEEAEEELEKHERSSTTSASSRTNPGEVDAPLNYHGFENSPQNKKMGNAVKDRDMGETSSWQELYDGCYFGDLMITFSATDKLLFEDDEETFNHHNKRKIHYNNKPNYTNYPKAPIVPIFNTTNQPYQNFNHRIEENNWKVKLCPPRVKSQDVSTGSENYFTEPLYSSNRNFSANYWL